MMTPGLRRLVVAGVASSLLSAGLVLLVAWILFGDDTAPEAARTEQVSEPTGGELEEPESAEAEPAEFEAAEGGVAEEIASSPATVEPDGEVVEPEFEAEREVAEAERDRPSEVAEPAEVVAEPAEVVAEPADDGELAVEVSELEPQTEVIEPEAEVPQQAEPEMEEAGEVESAAVVPEALEDLEPAVEVAEPEAVADVEDVAEVVVPEESAEDGPDVSADEIAEEEPVPDPDPVSFTLGGGARSGGHAGCSRQGSDLRCATRWRCVVLGGGRFAGAAQRGGSG